MIVTLNYRLGEDAAKSKNIDDVQAAIGWIKDNIANYGGDPNAMVLTGRSAGAHLIAEAEIERLNEGGIPIFKAIFPVDTAGFELTLADTSKLKFLINNAKHTVFGQDKKTLRAASPLFSLQENKPHPSVHVFVSALRNDAVAESKLYVSKLSNMGHQAKLSVLPASNSHADINNLIFKQDSQIYAAIRQTLLAPRRP